MPLSDQACSPEEITYNSGFTVNTPNAQDITDVSSVRLGGATHSYDFDQRFIWLNFNAHASDPKIQVAAPPTGFVAAPGYYMLFILDDGVPSVAAIVKVAPAP